MMKGKTIKPDAYELRDGLIFQDFCPSVPFHEKAIFSVSCTIPSGSVCLLRAPSGKGKSTFLSALTHLIEHTGDLMFAIEGQYVNVHTLSREDFDKKTFFFQEENVDKSARLIDLFKNINYFTCEDLLRSEILTEWTESCNSPELLTEMEKFKATDHSEEGNDEIESLERALSRNIVEQSATPLNIKISQIKINHLLSQKR